MNRFPRANLHPRGHTALVACLAVLALGAGNLATAAQFDFPRVLACRDVTPADFCDTHPELRVVEVVVPVSVRFGGDEGQYVEELNIDVAATSSALRVHDFHPETTLASEWSGDIHSTVTTEKSHALDATLGGELPLAAGELVAHVTPSIHGGLGRSKTATERTSRLAPKQPVVVSGTTGRSRGVFYKLKPNSQTTLEGIHELTIQFLAPFDWQTGSLDVTTAAYGHHKLFGIVEQPKRYGHDSAPVYLYLSGSSEARQVAERRAGTPGSEIRTYEVSKIVLTKNDEELASEESAEETPAEEDETSS